jgi:hypothetical protein
VNEGLYFQTGHDNILSNPFLIQHLITCAVENAFLKNLRIDLNAGNASFDR